MEPRTYLKDSFEFLPDERFGGMAVVRKAYLDEAGTACALKYPVRESSEGLASLSLNRELQALSDLEHENK